MKKKILTGLIIGTALSLSIVSSSVATPVNFEINAGGWADETSWNITQQTGGVWSEGMPPGAMNNYVDYTYNWDLDEGDYLLAIHDTWGDGLDHGGHVFLSVANVTLLDLTQPEFEDYYHRFNVPASEVPEPATMLIFASGLAGLVGYGRRKSLKK